MPIDRLWSVRGRLDSQLEPFTTRPVPVLRASRRRRRKDTHAKKKKKKKIKVERVKRKKRQGLVTF